VYRIGCRHGSDLLPPPPLPARDHPARDLALSPLHPELPRRRGTACRTRALTSPTRRSALDAEIRSRHRATATPLPGNRWHLDEMVVRIAGRQMYLWRAVDHEGEVLDMLVQRRRDTRAALRLIRKLLKKQGFAPKLLVTDKLRSYACPFRRLRLNCPHKQGCTKTIGTKTRIRRCDDESAKCSGSSRLDPPSSSSACTVRFTTPSTFNATSSPDPHGGSSEPKLPHSGKMPSQRHDARRVSALNACSIGLPQSQSYCATGANGSGGPVGDLALTRGRKGAQLCDSHHEPERVVRGASQPMPVSWRLRYCRPGWGGAR
jgi:transposase-like protein